jgi:hypothetical protein
VAGAGQDPGALRVQGPLPPRDLWVAEREVSISPEDPRRMSCGPWHLSLDLPQQAARVNDFAG